MYRVLTASAANETAWLELGRVACGGKARSFTSYAVDDAAELGSGLPLGHKGFSATFDQLVGSTARGHAHDSLSLPLSQGRRAASPFCFTFI